MSRGKAHLHSLLNFKPLCTGQNSFIPSNYPVPIGYVNNNNNTFFGVNIFIDNILGADLALQGLLVMQVLSTIIRGSVTSCVTSSHN